MKPKDRGALLALAMMLVAIVLVAGFATAEEVRVAPDIATRDLAAQEAMAYWSSWSVAISAIQLVLAVAGTIAVLVTLRATNRGNLIALQSEQRAWMGTSLELDGPLTFDPHGGLALGVNLVVTNYGKTPAENVHTNMTMFLNLRDAPRDLRTFANAHRRRDIDSGRVCLPGETYRRPWVLTADPSEIERHQLGNHLFVVVAGTVTYDVQHDRDIHQTGFIFWIEVLDESGNLSLSNLGEDVPLQRLRSVVGAGGFAD